MYACVQRYQKHNFKSFLARSGILGGIPFTVFRNRWGPLDMKGVFIHSVVISVPLLNAHTFIVLQTLSVSSFLLLLVIWFQILRDFSFCDSYAKSYCSMICFLPSVFVFKGEQWKGQEEQGILVALVWLIPTCVFLKLIGLCGSILAFQSRNLTSK